MLIVNDNMLDMPQPPSGLDAQETVEWIETVLIPWNERQTREDQEIRDAEKIKA
jgi:hypothetical protein